MVRKAQAPRIVMTRMPEGLHARLRKEAKLNARSVNAEIVHRLTQSFVRQEQQEQADLITAAVNRAFDARIPAHLMPMQAEMPLPPPEAAARQPTEPEPTVQTDKPKQRE